MAKRNVVFVLGAGAGVDLNMPLGAGLQNLISEYSDIPREPDVYGHPVLRDAPIRKALGILYRGKNATPYANALRQIHDGIYLRASIDDYLDRHRSNNIVNTCGKILITRAILYSERESHLHFQPDNIFNTIDFNKIRSTWLIRFWQMLARDTPTEKITSSLDHITFINFNYDRCLEHFLIHAFRGLDNWNMQEAHDFVRDKVRIFHPYGTVGPLHSVEFGDDNVDLVSLSQGIRTYTEQISDDTMVDKIRQVILSAHTLIFLGFHFHRQNIELLFDEKTKSSNVERVYATVFEMSDEDQHIVRSQITSIVRADVHPKARGYYLVNGKCVELFSRFEKTLDL